MTTNEKFNNSITVHTQKFIGGARDGEVNHRGMCAFHAVKDKIRHEPHPTHDVASLVSVYELHHLEMTSKTQAIGHYRLKETRIEKK